MLSRVIPTTKPMPGQTVLDRTGTESVVLSTGLKYLNVRDVATGMTHLLRITECTVKTEMEAVAPPPPPSPDEEFNG